MTRAAYAVALALLAAALLLATPAHSDAPTPTATAPAHLTPVLPPPVACGIPGWPACYIVYLPGVEVKR